MASEISTFALLIVLILFMLIFFQNYIKSDYLRRQQRDISRVDVIINSFINGKYNGFRDFLGVRDKRDAAVLMTGYSDIYYLDSGLRVISIIRREKGSSIFTGYDFNESGPAVFFRRIRSEVPAVSRLFRSPETDSLSIYIAAAEGARIIVARVDLEELAGEINRVARFNKNILLLTNPEGYILSSSKSDIAMNRLPGKEVDVISLEQEYMITKGVSESIGCGIAVLTPVSVIYRILDSMKIFFIIFSAAAVVLLAVKLYLMMKILVVPVEKFTSLIWDWDFERGGDRETGFLMKIKEIYSLYLTFYRKTMQVKTGIEKLKTKENEMQLMRNYLKNIIDSMPSVIVSTDPGGIITEWNRAAVRYTGVEPEYAIGKPLFEAFPHIEVIKDFYYEALRTGMGYEVKKNITRYDKSSDMNISIFPLSAETKEGIVIRLDDITMIEKAETKLRQAQKMEVIGTLAGGLAHDFNNILAGIQGSVSIMKVKTENSSDLNELKPVYEKYLGFLEQSADRSTEVIAKLLTLSKRDESVLSKIDINEIIAVVEKICSNSFDKSVSISVIPHDGEAAVKGNSTELEQALLNLCVNGAHAMTVMKEEGAQKGGTLSIAVSKVVPDSYFLKTHPESFAENEYWSISVKDSGVGMSREVLSGMYDPFFTTKGKSGGTGLGLTMVYNIVQHHGGFIDVYTEKGSGSEFIVYLPVPRGDSETAIPGLAGAIRKGTGTVLVVDDEEVIRTISAELLSMCGFSVLTAADGYEGVKKFQENSDGIDLVILDIIMPGISGIETYLMLKEIKKDVKVLLTSGFRHEEKIQEGMKLGINGFVQKPYNLNRLSEAVFKILDE